MENKRHCNQNILRRQSNTLVLISKVHKIVKITRVNVFIAIEEILYELKLSFLSSVRAPVPEFVSKNYYAIKNINLFVCFICLLYVQ